MKRINALLLVLLLIGGPAVQADPISMHNGDTGSDLFRIDTSTVPASIYGSLRSLPEKLGLPEEAVERMRLKYETLVLSSRYMDRNAVPTTYPRWEGFPLVKCRYDVKDADGTVKDAGVIMLNPTPIQLARWTVACCLIVKGSADSLWSDRLSDHIRQQSGAQFPIAGVVYEDMEGDGKYKIYCFRDGVTVKVKGIQHTGILPLDASAIETSLYGALDSSWTGQFARIQSTTREQYGAIGGPVEIGDKDHRNMIWLDVVRDLYKAAWNSDVNILFIAWAYANLK